MPLTSARAWRRRTAFAAFLVSLATALRTVEGVEPGDTILIHQGFAIARMPRR